MKAIAAPARRGERDMTAAAANPRPAHQLVGGGDILAHEEAPAFGGCCGPGEASPSPSPDGEPPLDECPICSCPTFDSDGPRSVRTGCGHAFHEVCLNHWREQCESGRNRFSCPVCRAALTDRFEVDTTIGAGVDEMDVEALLARRRAVWNSLSHLYHCPPVDEPLAGAWAHSAIAPSGSTRAPAVQHRLAGALYQGSAVPPRRPRSATDEYDSPRTHSGFSVADLVEGRAYPRRGQCARARAARQHLPSTSPAPPQPTSPAPPQHPSASPALRSPPAPVRYGGDTRCEYRSSRDTLAPHSHDELDAEPDAGWSAGRSEREPSSRGDPPEAGHEQHTAQRRARRAVGLSPSSADYLAGTYADTRHERLLFFDPTVGRFDRVGCPAPDPA